MPDTTNSRTIEYTKPIQYSPRLYANGFSSLPQRMSMEIAWKEIFHETLPRDYWHPRDFIEKFLPAVPVGQRSKYRTRKPKNFSKNAGAPIAMRSYFLRIRQMIRDLANLP